MVAPTVRALSWTQLLHSTWRLVWLSFRISLRRKFVFMAMGVLVYYGALYAFAVYQPGQGFSVNLALHVLVELPGAVLGIYLTMDLVARERDGETLETLFSTASSHYLIWTVRLVCVHVVLATTLLLMSALAYVLFAEFPVLAGGLNAFLPAFFIASLTFFFSAYARGANTAAMLGVAALLLVLITEEAWRDTSYWLFLNPFQMPLDGNEFYWVERVVLNRLGVLVAGGLLVFLGLRRMEQRERFLS